MIKFKQRIMLPLLIIFTMLIITRITSADFLHFIFLNFLFLFLYYIRVLSVDPSMWNRCDIQQLKL